MSLEVKSNHFSDRDFSEVFRELMRKDKKESLQLAINDISSSSGNVAAWLKNNKRSLFIEDLPHMIILRNRLIEYSILSKDDPQIRIIDSLFESFISGEEEEPISLLDQMDFTFSLAINHFSIEVNNKIKALLKVFEQECRNFSPLDLKNSLLMCIEHLETLHQSGSEKLLEEFLLNAEKLNDKTLLPELLESTIDLLFTHKKFDLNSNAIIQFFSVFKNIPSSEGVSTLYTRTLSIPDQEIAEIYGYLSLLEIKEYNNEIFTLEILSTISEDKRKEIVAQACLLNQTTSTYSHRVLCRLKFLDDELRKELFKTIIELNCTQSELFLLLSFDGSKTAEYLEVLQILMPTVKKITNAKLIMCMIKHLSQIEQSKRKEIYDLAEPLLRDISSHFFEFPTFFDAFFNLVHQIPFEKREILSLAEPIVTRFNSYLTRNFILNKIIRKESCEFPLLSYYLSLLNLLDSKYEEDFFSFLFLNVHDELGESSTFKDLVDLAMSFGRGKDLFFLFPLRFSSLTKEVLQAAITEYKNISNHEEIRFFNYLSFFERMPSSHINLFFPLLRKNDYNYFKAVESIISRINFWALSEEERVKFINNILRLFQNISNFGEKIHPVITPMSTNQYSKHPVLYLWRTITYILADAKSDRELLHLIDVVAPIMTSSDTLFDISNLLRLLSYIPVEDRKSIRSKAKLLLNGMKNLSIDDYFKEIKSEERAYLIEKTALFLQTIQSGNVRLCVFSLLSAVPRQDLSLMLQQITPSMTASIENYDNTYDENRVLKSLKNVLILSKQISCEGSPINLKDVFAKILVNQVVKLIKEKKISEIKILFDVLKYKNMYRAIDGERDINQLSLIAECMCLPAFTQKGIHHIAKFFQDLTEESEVKAVNQILLQTSPEKFISIEKFSSFLLNFKTAKSKIAFLNKFCSYTNQDKEIFFSSIDF
jgi:hypothetical protein